MLRTASTIVWLIGTLAVMFLVLQPIGSETQLLISLATTAFLFIITRITTTGPLRYIALAAASIIVLRFAYWRTVNTLPPIDDIASFIPGILLYAAEMFCIGMFLISVFVVADPIERAEPVRQSDDDLPTVDVFVPSYNESADILSLTLAAALQMDYPRDKMTVYLLDDGGTDAKRNSPDPDTAEAANRRAEELSELCRELGAVYMTRAENNHAKAGNLNAGLQRTQGEIVVVFDADHAPERSFLKSTIGHFAEDPNLFLVQTPHFFANPDPIERNLGTYKRMPAENEMFYSMIQKGLDRWNASFFCGSAALLRREALEEVGGFSGITITEDCETALELHARGWNSRYVDKPLVTGLQPETFASFIGQRSRWCRGMVQILMLKNPVFKPGLTLAQRLCYLSNCLFWVFPFIRLTFLVAPLLFILFDLKIYNASAEDFMAYTVTYLVSAEILRNYLYGRVRWPLISELYEYVQSIYLVRALVSVFLNPRKPTFNVTEKGVSLTQRHLSSLAWPFFIIFAGLAVVLYVSIRRYQSEPALGDLIVITGLWNLANLIIAGAALGIVTEQPSDVDGISLPTAKAAELRIGDRLVPVTVERISATQVTFQIREGSLSARPGDVGAIIPRTGRDRGVAGEIPVVFRVPVAANQTSVTVEARCEARHYKAVAAIMLADLDVPRQIRMQRQRRRLYIAELLILLKWVIVGPVSALATALTGRAARPRVDEARRLARAPADRKTQRPQSVPSPAQAA